MSLSGPGVKILLIDDDPVILRGYGQRMRTEGWDVTTAGDGYEALTAAASRQWDLILLDLRIPYRNGVEVLKLLRQRKETSETTIWVLAQPGDADFVDRAMRNGADGVFEKARLGPRDIVLEIERILEAKRNGPPRPGHPPVAVPAAVDEIAKRFRKPDTGPVAAQSVNRSSGGWTAGPHVRPAPPTIPGQRTVAPQIPNVPPYGTLDEDENPTVRGPGGPPAATHVAAPQSYVAPMPSVQMPVTDATSQPPGTYDMMINRKVGQTAGLAAALGLPADFTCPVCQSHLVLRLASDPNVENGVHGHFFCPRCTR